MHHTNEICFYKKYCIIQIYFFYQIRFNDIWFLSSGSMSDVRDRSSQSHGCQKLQKCLQRKKICGSVLTFLRVTFVIFISLS